MGPDDSIRINFESNRNKGNDGCVIIYTTNTAYYLCCKCKKYLDCLMNICHWMEKKGIKRKKKGTLFILYVLEYKLLFMGHN